jgi:hypothetical protein
MTICGGCGHSMHWHECGANANAMASCLCRNDVATYAPVDIDGLGDAMERYPVGSPPSDTPRTEAGRRLYEAWLAGDAHPDFIDQQRDIILAIEREAAAAYVWDRLEATPGFNEEMDRGRADIAAGRGTPFRPRAHPDEEPR